MEKDVSEKVLEGQVARMNRRMNKLMNEQMDIVRQIYKVDNRLDKISFELTKNPDAESLKDAQKKYGDLLDNLVKEKYAYNTKLEQEKVKLDKYVDELMNLKKETAQDFGLFSLEV